TGPHAIPAAQGRGEALPERVSARAAPVRAQALQGESRRCVEPGVAGVRAIAASKAEERAAAAACASTGVMAPQDDRPAVIFLGHLGAAIGLSPACFDFISRDRNLRQCLGHARIRRYVLRLLAPGLLSC